MHYFVFFFFAADVNKGVKVIPDIIDTAFVRLGNIEFELHKVSIQVTNDHCAALLFVELPDRPFQCVSIKSTLELLLLLTNPPESCSRRGWSRNGQEGCSDMLHYYYYYYSHDVIVQMVTRLLMLDWRCIDQNVQSGDVTSPSLPLPLSGLPPPLEKKITFSILRWFRSCRTTCRLELILRWKKRPMATGLLSTQIRWPTHWPEASFSPSWKALLGQLTLEWRNFWCDVKARRWLTITRADSTLIRILSV